MAVFYVTEFQNYLGNRDILELYPNSPSCPLKNSHVALTFSNSVHFRVVMGSLSKSYTRAPGIASKNGECVAMMNWHP